MSVGNKQTSAETVTLKRWPLWKETRACNTAFGGIGDCDDEVTHEFCRSFPIGSAPNAASCCVSDGGPSSLVELVSSRDGCLFLDRAVDG